MQQRWVERVRRKREARLAEQREAWLASLRRFVDACQTSLRPLSMPDDLLESLHRLDWQLEHIRSTERSLKRELRRQAPGLDARVRGAAGEAFRLRNLVTSFSIRWQAFEEAERSGGPMVFLDRREMEEALLNANRAARDLAAEVDKIDPVLRLAPGRPSGPSDDAPPVRR
jgi:hypothetical protein